MKEHKFCFGILGCGMIAGIHANAICTIPEALLVGVADANAERAAQFAAQHGVRAYESYDQMLSDPEIDVICICTPSGFHAENALAALQHGKHVVLEKPMALSVESADRIVAACERAGKLLTVISQLRFSEDVQRVKALLAENAFGRVALCSLYMKYHRSKEYYASSPWKGTKAFDGGGALMNQGIHGVDLLEYIVGPVREVTGKARTLSHKIEVEDTAVAMLEFENGALGVIEASTCAYPGFERRIEIHGDKGYVMLRDNKIEKMMVNGEEISAEVTDTGTSRDPAALNCEMHRRQIQNLLAAIRGEEALVVDAREGRKAIRVIEAVYRT
ncbi:MAG: Gfo/Idh/MocA family oxidoreductase [Clostridia bacterium]|nr:Gfo/Idh/MocA family oxidoreductase [Clostridia bacterium]